MATKHKIKIWPVPSNGRVAYPEKSLSRYRGKSNVGVCFSGGGTRSATASLGQMRALRALGYDSQIKYISSISGGSWFATPYTFLPNSYNDDQFLGRYSSNIKIGLINYGGQKRFDETINGRENAFANCIKNADMLNDWVLDTLTNRKATTNWRRRNSKLYIHEVWGYMLDEIFFKPFRSDRNQDFGINQPEQNYLALSRQHADGMVSRNNHLQRNDFSWPRDKRPFLIVCGTIMHKKSITMIKEAITEGDKPIRDLFSMKHDWDKFFFPIEMTPYYSGTVRLYKGDATYGNIKIGGGFIESLGMNTKDPLGKLDRREAEVKFDSGSQHRFSPQDMIAVSGAAPAAHALWYRPAAKIVGAPSVGHITPIKTDNSVKTIIRKLPDIFPKYRTWPIEVGERVGEDKLDFGDGGFLDNYGILPLLRRQVPKIIAFINADVPLNIENLRPITKNNQKIYTSSQFAELMTRKNLHNHIQIDGGLPILFGEQCLATDVTSVWAKEFNHVFRREGQKYKGTWYSKSLADTLRGLAQAKANGGPICFKRKYQVRRNIFHGIFDKTSQGKPYEVEIIWFYNDKCANFAQDVFNSQAQQFFNRQCEGGELKSFPHYKTFYPAGHSDELNNANFRDKITDKLEPVKLSHNQIVALSNLTAWCVDQADQKGMFRSFFKPKKK